MWSFTILCCRVCELVQLVVDQFLTQSFKQLKLKPSPKSQFFDKLCYQFSSCSLQTEISYAFCVLLSHILDFVAIEHILPHLLTNPSMLWHLHQVSKEWSIGVRKTTSWNVLTIVKTNNYWEMISRKGLYTSFF
jgi:hypothetical protein